MKKEEERMQRDIIIMQANNSLRHDMRRDTFLICTLQKLIHTRFITKILEKFQKLSNSLKIII